MNKRALIGLAVVPVVLMFVVKHLQLQRMEQKADEFRSNFKRDAPVGEAGPIAKISVGTSGTEFLGCWERKQLNEALNDVHLMPYHEPKGSDDYWNGLQIEAGADSNAPHGIFLSRDSDEGWYVMEWRTDGRSDHLMLTPESCRALKKRIWRDFGPKLRALHIPPPR